MDSQALHAEIRRHLEPWLAPDSWSGEALPDDLGERLADFGVALLRRNERVNLTGITAPREVALRHLLDSLLALPLTPREGALCDLGSGGGVPGLPLALARPGLRVALVESRRRKAEALAAIVDELDLAPRVEVVHERGEAWLSSHAVDTVLTRAVGPVLRQLELLAPVRGAFAHLVMLKGPAVDEELALAAPHLARLGFDEPRRHEAALPQGEGSRVLLDFRGERPSPGAPA